MFLKILLRGKVYRFQWSAFEIPLKIGMTHNTYECVSVLREVGGRKRTEERENPHGMCGKYVGVLNNKE